VDDARELIERAAFAPVREVLVQGRLFGNS